LESLSVFVMKEYYNLSSDLFVSSILNIPIRFVFPTYDYYIDKNCSWVSLTDVVFSGVFLSYFHRIDKAHGIK